MSDLLQHQPLGQLPPAHCYGLSGYSKPVQRAALALLRIGWSPHWVAAALGLREREVAAWALVIEGREPTEAAR